MKKLAPALSAAPSEGAVASLAPGARSAKQGDSQGARGGGARAEGGALNLSAVPRSKSLKLGATIAGLIEGEILEKSLPADTPLGTETELMQHFGVSGEAIREAVRQLEQHGMVIMRRGGNGGLFVAQPAHNSAVRALAAYLELSQVSLRETVEAKTLIEVQSAGLAAERIDEEGVQNLQSLARELNDRPGLLAVDARRNLKVTSAISECCGNPAIALFLQSLSTANVDQLRADIEGSMFHAQAISLNSKILRRLVEAISLGDALAAQQQSRSLSILYRRMASIYENGRPADKSPTDEIRHLATEPSSTVSKLGERTALAIAEDVARMQLPEGHKLGSEPELTAHYGVSRQAFREAIRILELHSIVRTQRGRGGGLVVGRPDPAYAIESAVNFLRYVKLKPQQYYEVIRPLELGATRLAVKRASDADLESLNQALAETMKHGADDYLQASRQFHQRLSEISGNRAVSLLLHVLLAITREAAVPPPELISALRKNDVELAASITQRKEGLATRQMLEHLRLMLLCLAPA